MGTLILRGQFLGASEFSSNDKKYYKISVLFLNDKFAQVQSFFVTQEDFLNASKFNKLCNIAISLNCYFYNNNLRYKIDKIVKE